MEITLTHLRDKHTGLEPATNWKYNTFHSAPFPCAVSGASLFVECLSGQSLCLLTVTIRSGQHEWVGCLSLDISPMLLCSLERAKPGISTGSCSPQSPAHIAGVCAAGSSYPDALAVGWAVHLP